MNIAPNRLLDALMRTDFLTFAQRVFREINPNREFHVGWHHQTIAYFAARAAAGGDIDRLIVNLPPRSAKSTLLSVALPAFVLGRDPTKRVIVVSYNQNLSNSFSRQTRQVMQTPWYRRLFPDTVIPNRAAEEQYFTSRGGWRMATSTGGTLTGKGGDLIIIDDPLKADDAYSETARDALYGWAMKTLFTRLDEKTKGSIILTQQRQHEDDLSGHMLRTGEWLDISLPAIAVTEERFILSTTPLRSHLRRVGDLLDPVREPLEVLRGLKRQMGTAAFEAQYQQAPMPPDGDVIKLSWFRTYDALPEGGETVFSVDTASKAGLRNDWSVIGVWRIVDDRCYLDYLWRRRVEYPELKRSLIDLAGQYLPNRILIEDKGSGSGLLQDLKAEGYPVNAYEPGSLDKESRMRIQSAKIEAGRVLLPAQAPWLEEFQNEVRRFPNGAHDDQIDALSQLLDYAFAPKDTFFILSYRT
ncbi:phage terminase large subunit [Sphingomonas profundi]|uniref:phage terminase large subunit n=1 Tax=Alterirhizorhabdus profundi TaxID=2681549 RepID=UPI0012E97859|nr:phage terminase large subunit [Sphingomonas profundi]